MYMIAVCFYVELYGTYVAWHYAVVLYKELAFGKRNAVAYEDNSTVYSFAETVLVKRKAFETALCRKLFVVA